MRGQYGPGRIGDSAVPGYRQEPGVKPDSTTETFAAVRLQVENWRWAGVPFYLRTGKRLANNVTEIRVHFKRTPQALFAGADSGSFGPNVVSLRIQPDEGISVSFGAKRPGTHMSTVPVMAKFSYSEAFGGNTPVAYETLILDAMRGDATLFTRRDEVEVGVEDHHAHRSRRGRSFRLRHFPTMPPAPRARSRPRKLLEEFRPSLDVDAHSEESADAA